MAHPCASPRPPAWCNKKKSRKKATRKKAFAMTCSCPKGWERKGIMCKKAGASFKRATCKPKRKSR